MRKKPSNLVPAARAIANSSFENVRDFVRKMLVSPNYAYNDEALMDIISLFQIAFRDFKPGSQIPYRLTPAELEPMTMPVHLVVGEHDRLFDAERVIKRATYRIPGLEESHVLENTGHALENYDQLMRLVNGFLMK